MLLQPSEAHLQGYPFPRKVPRVPPALFTIEVIDSFVQVVACSCSNFLVHDGCVMFLTIAAVMVYQVSIVDCHL